MDSFLHDLVKSVAVPSLQRISALKIAAVLWNVHELRILIDELRFHCLNHYAVHKKWKSIQDIVVKRVFLTELPVTLKQTVISFVHSVGLEILNWKELHEDKWNEYPVYHVDLPKEFRWTPRGTIDKKETAKLMISDGNLDLALRFELACVYCLESDIRELWNGMSDGYKKCHFAQHILMNSKIRNGWRSSLEFWVHVMNGNNPNTILDRLRLKDTFRDVVHFNHLSAVEYFLQRLTPAEREESILKCFENSLPYCASYCDHVGGSSAEVYFFLLSQLSEEQLRKALDTGNCTADVLKCALTWPWQDSFMDIVDHLMPFIPLDAYYGALIEIVTKILDMYEDCDYQNIFTGLWKKGHVKHKMHVLYQCLFNGELLAHLGFLGNKENIRLIFGAATLQEKEHVINNVRPCGVAPFGRKRFHLRRRYYVEHYGKLSKREIFRELLQFLRAYLQEEKEKSIVEDQYTPPCKKLCHDNSKTQ